MNFWPVVKFLERILMLKILLEGWIFIFWQIEAKLKIFFERNEKIL